MRTSFENEKDERYRPPSYSDSESDDFSLWSDTGDIAEQLTNSEDPLRIELESLTREGQRLQGSGRGRGGGRKKRVGFQEQDHTERDQPSLSAEKEAIFVPEPPPRQISKTEALLALIMAPTDPQTARSKGLVGKPLLYEPRLVLSRIHEWTDLHLPDTSPVFSYRWASFFLDMIRALCRAS